MNESLAAILAQSRPSDTTAVSVYSPPASTITQIAKIILCETAGNTPAFRIFLDNDGTTYDETTALYFDTAMTANGTTTIEGNWWMTGGNLAVRTSAGSEITFTVFGAEHNI